MAKKGKPAPALAFGAGAKGGHMMPGMPMPEMSPDMKKKMKKKGMDKGMMK